MGLLDFLFKKPCAEFEKVSFEQFVSDWTACFNEPNPSLTILQEIYDIIQVPTRSTDGSAGYDLVLPYSFKLKHKESIVIPTGLRCRMDDSSFLMIVPRSGQGFKYRIALVNTAGIIDSDYYNADNMGHIMVKITYDGCPEKETKLRTERGHRLMYGGKLQLFLEGVHDDAIIPSEIRFEAGKGFAQAIFLKYGRSKEKKNFKERTGGFGSTDK